MMAIPLRPSSAGMWLGWVDGFEGCMAIGLGELPR